MVSWSAIQSLLIFFGPLLYQRFKSFYASTRTTLPPVPLPRTIERLLDLLFLTALLSLLLTLPRLSPENIFTRTNSRLQTPTDVLFTRLSHLRALTPADDVLRSRLTSKDARLLYAAYGPRPLVECHWCTLEEPNTFLWYALPSLMFPHLLHLVVLGMVTSSYFSKFGHAWRTQATLAAAAAFGVEIWMVGVSSGDFQRNAVARSEAEVVWTHWRMRVFRGVALATVDVALGYVLYLSATRRWSVGWEGHVVESRVEDVLRSVEKSHAMLRAASFVKQTVMRDTELRGKAVEWWAREDATERELMADEEVQTVRQEVLPTKMNLEALKSEAERRSQMVMSSMQDGPMVQR